MNGSRAALVAAALIAAGTFAGYAAAQDKKEDVVIVEERTRVVEPGDEEFSRQMKEAEEQLALAARRVAELSAERLERYDGKRYMYDLGEQPRLGVNIGADDGDAAVEGVSVVSVSPGSAAEDAGLRAGDLITAVNGESLAADTQEEANKRLLDFMRGVEEGDTVAVTYRRGNSSATVDVEPRPVPGTKMFVWAPDGRNFSMPRPPEVVPAPVVVDRLRYGFGSWAGAWGDLEVVELTEGLGRYFGTDEGLLVISAPRSSDLKLEEGDVIQSIDGRKPGSVDHCMRILASYQPGETLKLEIMRDKRRETLRVAIPDTRTSRAAPAARVAPAAPEG